MLSFQLEEHCGERRKLDAHACIAVLPRDILRPDFAQVADVRTAEHACVRVEDFLPLALCGGTEAVIVADDRGKVEYAENLVAVVVFTDKTHDGIVGVVAPDPFESGVVVVDFPEWGVILVDAVQNLHHLQ